MHGAPLQTPGVPSIPGKASPRSRTTFAFGVFIPHSAFALRPWSNQNVKVPVHLAGEIGQDHRGRVHLRHDRWARQAVAGPQLGSIVDRSREESAVKVNTVLIAEGLGRVGSVQL